MGGKVGRSERLRGPEIYGCASLQAAQTCRNRKDTDKDHDFGFLRPVVVGLAVPPQGVSYGTST